uniref:Cordon-bleu ubiquitin-like domain-containing protein n=1 Tax=Oryzias latipes TaxID=8090 RepID=A0A3P9JV06_ORYLA
MLCLVKKNAKGILIFFSVFLFVPVICFRRVMKTRAPPPPLAPQPAPLFSLMKPKLSNHSNLICGPSSHSFFFTCASFLFTNAHTHTHTHDLLFLSLSSSKALMDLLVELCSRHHLNPALHTLDLWSSEGLPLAYKPNSCLGSLNLACVLIKEKVVEEKVARRPAPKVPEKTVRLMVNYHVNQKAVVRVNPLVALQTLTPTICSKCELDPSHVLLLKDSVSHHELPLDKSLAELGIKELYVHDQSLGNHSNLSVELCFTTEVKLLDLNIHFHVTVNVFILRIVFKYFAKNINAKIEGSL